MSMPIILELAYILTIQCKRKLQQLFKKDMEALTAKMQQTKSVYKVRQNINYLMSG